MTDIFDSKSSSTDAAGTTQPTQEQLTLLVGEGRKYATPEDLAKGYLHADQFVETLKEENQRLREEKKKSEIMEAELERYRQQQASSSTQSNSSDAAAASGLSEADVARIVEQTITGAETNRTKAENMRKANALMEAKFGEKAKEIFRREANTPELVNSFKALAEVSPEKFVSLFTSEPSTPSQASGSGTVNTEASKLVPQGSADEPGTKAYYNKLRKEKPNEYYSQRVQLQMIEDAKNREKFYGRS